MLRSPILRFFDWRVNGIEGYQEKEWIILSRAVLNQIYRGTLDKLGRVTPLTNGYPAILPI